MGGDDLGDYDEVYLDGSISDSSDGSIKRDNPMKRDREDRHDQEEEASTSRKRKRPEDSLIEAGRCIGDMTVDKQANFLTTLIKHYTLLESPAAQVECLRVPAQHMLVPKGNTVLERIKSVNSIKKLKKWKSMGSPGVILVCISARRAVAVLQEIASLKVRVAKLFPKNGSLKDQQKLLQQSQICMAVGTPARLAALTETGSLSLEHTRLLVFDMHLSNKAFSVVS